MQTYLVGGAVRDTLLQKPIKDRDWVVIGATPEQLLRLGYTAVGHDFPVFLHPQSHEEYALARTERKIGSGYHGFSCDTGAHIRLEEDLARRDLTINAMAQDVNGQLIDPYGGQADLHAKVLRHVSPAFAEDPLRVLRVARFAARYANEGFSIAPETLILMTHIVNQGELAHLSVERIWLETHKALGENRPDVYIEVLQQCGALAVLFPEIAQLFGVPQRAEYHPEVDTGIHILMCLRIAARDNLSTRARFAVLLHDLGKGITPKEQLPRHINHEQTGVPLVRALCQRYKVPRDHQQLAEMVCEQHLNCHRVLELQAKTLWRKLQQLDAIRRPERFIEFLQACQADAQGRLGFEHKPYPQFDYFKQAQQIVAQITPKQLPNLNQLQGEQIGYALGVLRIQALQAFKQHYHAP
jgi:tRNA nucleotidyltransferase (CCA-adding enzyme)